MSAAVDPVELAQALIRCPSVTPADAGALGLLSATLVKLGFACHSLRFEAPGTAAVDNLYARLGTASPNFCFAGHTDVVPVGAADGWTREPFSAAVEDGVLFGRGATDMKGAIAAFVAAVERFTAARGRDFGGSISLLITGDEEGPSINGTRKVLDWMAGHGESIDACLVGEPTNPEQLGEMVKIGRRGSLNGRLTVAGTQGHTAYPHLAENPLPRLVRMLAALLDTPLDHGSEHFQPSDLQLTTIDVGNPATNVIPAFARAAFNVRFNDRHTAASLSERLRQRLDSVGGDYTLEIDVTGEAFLTPPGPFIDIVVEAITAVAGHPPVLSTTGGTSDARFIKDYCPVAEFGLISQTMHKVDERVAVDDIARLTAIYHAVLDRFFPDRGRTAS